MKRALLAAILATIVLLPGAPAALAGDHPVMWRYTAPGHALLPFPRSQREASVWGSGACWSRCGAFCAWGMAGCLRTDAQGQCLELTDKCDRYCQRECRTWGGPLLPLDF